jgi:hypothetical protein
MRSPPRTMPRKKGGKGQDDDEASLLASAMEMARKEREEVAYHQGSSAAGRPEQQRRTNGEHDNKDLGMARYQDSSAGLDVLDSSNHQLRLLSVMSPPTDVIVPAGRGRRGVWTAHDAAESRRHLENPTLVRLGVCRAMHSGGHLTCSVGRHARS